MCAITACLPINGLRECFAEWHERKSGKLEMLDSERYSYYRDTEKYAKAQMG